MTEWIVMIGFLAYFLIGHSLWGLFRFNAIEKAILKGKSKRRDLYRDTIISSWIPALLILSTVFWGLYEPEELGLCGIAWHAAEWFSIPYAVLFVLALAFFIYQTVMLRITAYRGHSIAFKLPGNLLALLPETRSEKILWTLVSLTAGITEELLFRGYLMAALESLFPGLYLVPVLLLSSAVFGAMHLYLGAGEALKTTAIGVFYGLAYVAFCSLLPGMLLHFVQDLSNTDLKSVRIKEDTSLM